jgi:hypothetical protein
MVSSACEYEKARLYHRFSNRVARVLVSLLLPGAVLVPVSREFSLMIPTSFASAKGMTTEP